MDSSTAQAIPGQNSSSGRSDTETARGTPACRRVATAPACAHAGSPHFQRRPTRRRRRSHSTACCGLLCRACAAVCWSRRPSRTHCFQRSRMRASTRCCPSRRRKRWLLALDLCRRDGGDGVRRASKAEHERDRLRRAGADVLYDLADTIVAKRCVHGWKICANGRRWMLAFVNAAHFAQPGQGGSTGRAIPTPRCSRMQAASSCSRSRPTAAQPLVPRAAALHIGAIAARRLISTILTCRYCLAGDNIAEDVATLRPMASSRRRRWRRIRWTERDRSSVLRDDSRRGADRGEALMGPSGYVT